MRKTFLFLQRTRKACVTSVETLIAIQASYQLTDNYVLDGDNSYTDF